MDHTFEISFVNIQKIFQISRGLVKNASMKSDSKFIKIPNLIIRKLIMLALGIQILIQIQENVTYFLRFECYCTCFFPISISIDKWHRHEMILVTDGVSENVLSVMP